MNRIDFMNDAKGTLAQKLYNIYEGAQTEYRVGTFNPDGGKLVPSRLEAAKLIFRMHGYHMSYEIERREVTHSTYMGELHEIWVTYSLMKMVST